MRANGLKSRTSGFRLARAWKRDDGSSIVELALILPLFLFLFSYAMEFGRIYYISVGVAAAAQAGAQYGVINPGDVNGMQSASLAGAPGISGLSVTPTYGCECSDGTSVVASCTSTPACTNNYVNYVDVAVQATYSPFLQYPGLPGTMTISKDVRMRVGGD